MSKEELKKKEKSAKAQQHVYDLDSSDEDREETLAKLGPSMQKFIKSDGFDADVIDNRRYSGIRAMSPLELSAWMNELLMYSNCAIQTYNTTRGKKLKVVEVVKVIRQPLGLYTSYNITFTAKGHGKKSAATTFQASLYSTCADLPVEVELCRPAPRPSSS